MAPRSHGLESEALVELSASLLSMVQAARQDGAFRSDPVHPPYTARRLRRQAVGERRKLTALFDAPRPPVATVSESSRSQNEARGPRSDPRLEWLDTPKNLSGRASAHARGLVRLQHPEGTTCRWVDAPAATELLDQGWTLE